MSKRILIIDDEENIRRVMRLALETAGYKVGEAADGVHGLEEYGDGSNWDAVVLDQRMPDIDGLETLRLIKERDATARVIMATAYASIELAVDAMKLGATDFVRKPMTPENLRNAVTAALAKKIERPAGVEESGPSKRETTSPGIIETVTMNGFSILDTSEEQRQASNQRRFLVVGPDGTRQEVLVEIDEEAVGYVARLTRRRLPPESSFWTEAARDLLSDYLWNKGEIPRTGKLTLKDLDPDKLPIAERWGQD
jgi:DNA-binding NtrC family response regulator